MKKLNWFARPEKFKNRLIMVYTLEFSSRDSDSPG